MCCGEHESVFSIGLMKPNIEHLFAVALEIAGNETRLAQLAGCSQNAIWAARRAGRVSATMAVRLEAATDGKVPRWKLRPDLWDAPGASEPSAPDCGAAA